MAIDTWASCYLISSAQAACTGIALDDKIRTCSAWMALFLQVTHFTIGSDLVVTIASSKT